MHTFMPVSEPGHMLALSPDFFVLSYAHELQLWDTNYCTSQSTKAIVCVGSKVRGTPIHSDLALFTYYMCIRTHILTHCDWHLTSIIAV